MICTCQKLQGVIYRRKDGSFYLLDATCPEHGGMHGTKIAYVIFDEATGAQLSSVAPTLTSPCEACELEKKNGGEYMNHSCTRRNSAAPKEGVHTFNVEGRELSFCTVCGISRTNINLAGPCRAGIIVPLDSAAPPSEREALERQAAYYFSEIRKFSPLNLDHYSLENWEDFIVWREARAAAPQAADAEYWKARAEIAELKVLAFHEEIARAAAVSQAAPLRELADYIVSVTGPTGGWLVSPKDVQDKIIALDTLVTAPLERSAKYFFHETPWMCDNSVGPIWPLEANNQVFKFAEEFKAWASTKENS